MARKDTDFKHDGIPAGQSYAYKAGADISSAHTLIAAPSVSNQAIVITDIMFSKATAGDLTLTDGSTDIAVLYAGAGGELGSVNVVSFTGPLRLTAGNAFKVKLDNTNTNYSVLVTYYLED